MSDRLFHAFRAAVLTAIALGSAAAAGAQDFRGSILGLVSDTQGGAIPGASVMVTNLATNVATTVVTDSSGRYRVPYLNSGSYSVSIQLDGFKTVVRKPIEVRVGDA
jgi:hypothetical protein